MIIPARTPAAVLRSAIAVACMACATAAGAQGVPPDTAPLPVVPDNPFMPFARYAVQTAIQPPETGGRKSVLFDQASLIYLPRRLTCGQQPLAVAIDLDPGTRLFNPDDPPAPAPGLTDALSIIRAAGITVFWVSGLPSSKTDKVRTVIRALGFDAQAKDRVLLVRPGDRGKQARRNAAAPKWCFIALAGDRQGDFEQALDYLRDPAGPIAQALQPMFDAGWFRIPNPID